MALQLWLTLKEAITVYTGLSPVTFCTVLAMLWAIYYVVTGLFGSSDDHHQRTRAFEEQMKPLPPPVQLGEITEEELSNMMGRIPRSHSSWPSRARSMMFLKAECFMDLVDLMHCLLERMLSELLQRYLLKKKIQLGTSLVLVHSNWRLCRIGSTSS